jgi:hypothetical protein
MSGRPPQTEPIMPEYPASSSPPAPPLPDWLPPHDVSLRAARCGEAFDAVRVSQSIGAYALELLAGRSGGVIADRRSGVLYWLIPPGAAAGWDLPVRVYGSACFVWVPSLAPDETRGVHWLVPPDGDGLTDPGELCDALAAAVAALLGPRPETGR